jgi:F-box protein 9
MDPPQEGPSSELASFREQWRREVQARSGGRASISMGGRQDDATGASSSSTRYTGPPRKPAKASSSKSAVEAEDEDYAPSPSFGDAGPEAPGPGRPTRLDGRAVKAEPVSALEHYEKAVEKEALGNLGDSLNLYRKAFRMDSAVDQSYKAKHFPPSLATTKSIPEGASADGRDPAADVLDRSAPLSMKELIASFASATLEPVRPAVEGMPQPSSPVTEIPDEILVHILQEVAIADVGDFVRLALVSKRLAYLVATENRIWRRVCLGKEFGFSGMHHHWQTGVLWDALDEDWSATIESRGSDGHASSSSSSSQQAPMREEQDRLKTATTLSLYSALYSSSWQRMFRLRPRLRFNGCYISTVNYIRAGQSSVSHISWTSNPVHIVTYYRYLRLFRDGTAISLLTTDEPPDVVHHLTKDLVALHRSSSPTAHLPGAVMQSALRGRWRLGSAAAVEQEQGQAQAQAQAQEQEQAQPGRPPPPQPQGDAVEGELCVETEGVGKYVYRMELSLRTAGKGGGARHNKLAWRGFYSYNRLTDDWAEFGLKHDKNFFFSRVKSYGLGEQ